MTFSELLSYTDYLAQRWLSYFEKNPQALEVDVGGQTGSLRDLAAHIFMVEGFFANRLLGDQSPPPKDKPKLPSLDTLRGQHQETVRKLSGYIAAATEEGLRQKHTFGAVSVSSRKILAQALLHSVHHWAQVAMEVRKAGFPAEKPQDIIISPVME